MKKSSKKQLQAAKDSVKKVNRQIARDNEKFEAMTPTEKRVQIARDVLSQLRLKRLTAVSGVWLQGGDDSPLFENKDVEKNPELKDILAKTERCEGCALGGLFMCAVERADKIKLGELACVKEYKEEAKAYKNTPEYINDVEGTMEFTDAFKYLKKFFSAHQLEMIEEAFEQGSGNCSTTNDHAAGFVIDIDDEEDRMRLIMENIIVNNGLFKPEKRPVQSWTTPGLDLLF